MNKYFRLSFIVLFSVAAGFYSAISFSQTDIHSMKANVDKEYGDRKVFSEDDGQKGFFEDVVLRVKRDYVEEKTDRQIYESATGGLLSSLDPHSSYLNSEQYKEMQVQTKGEFGGLGIEVTLEYQVVKVVTAIEDTPAFKAGVKSGDYIIKVDGKSIAGLPIDEVVKKLRGKPNTEVKITIIRKGEKEVIEKKIKRDIIKVKAVRASRFKDVAYIKINSFSEQTEQGVITELRQLRNQIGKNEIKGLVIDLRNNPGGLLDQSVRVSDIFLDEGKKIVSISGRNKSDEKIYLDEKNEELIPNVPIAVLINEGSASASEIVAGALQDNKRAVIMGIKSFGKGSVQTLIPLAKNQGALRLTTALYYTPSGKSIQAHGIEPDIIVSDAKIAKEEKKDRDSESDLLGHISKQIESHVAEDKKDQLKDDNIELYDKDYQLARAIDLLRGINVYKKR